MPKTKVEYAPLEQHEVTSSNGEDNNHTRIAADDEMEADDELSFHGYKGGPSTHVCWKALRSLTKLEKFLIVVVALLVALVVVKFAVDNSKPQESCCLPDHTGGKAPPCTTRGCIEIASRVALALDEETNPCDDFYQFSCGGWQKKNPLPPGHSRWSAFNTLWEDNQVTLRNALESNASLASSAEVKASELYRACLDLDAINALGRAPLLEVVDQVGGWAMLNSTNLTGFSFNDTMRRFKSFIIFPFFQFGVETDSKHSNSNVIALGEGGLTAGSMEYYINKTVDDDQILSAVLQYMTEVAVLLGGERNSSRAGMREILELEGRLASISTPPELQRDGERNYHKVPLSQMKSVTPAIEWSDLFTSAFKELGNVTLTDDEPIVVSSIGYFKNLSEVIYTTPARVLHNFLMWAFTRTFLGAMGQPFMDARNKLSKVKYGADQSCLERWRECIETVDTSMGQAVGRLFVKHAFDRESKTSAEAMVTAIKAAFLRNLDGLDWMDPVTKKKAAEKADAVEDLIGFSDDILNVTYINDQFKELEVPDPSTYFGFQVNLFKFMAYKNMKELRKPVIRDEWSASPQTVNAYYSPNRNVILFPAGILHYPFYSSNFPKAMNFGGIGVVVGHELTHGFDDQGRQYDAAGNLDDWWENATLASFKKKTECMVDQYNQYTIAGAHVKGNLTIGENIADNGGVKFAYDAYQQWRTTPHPPEADMLLPSLNYTREQLFFIGFAQIWCSTATPQHLRNQLITDAHSPARVRVLGTMSNSPDFATAFSCPTGSPMNPKKKCTVW